MIFNKKGVFCLITLIIGLYMLVPGMAFGQEGEPFSIKLNWGDAADNLPANLNIDRENDTSISTFKIQATVEYRGDGSQIYDPGDVTFSVDCPGLPHASISGVSCDGWNYEVHEKTVSYDVDLQDKVPDKIEFSNSRSIKGAFTSSVQVVFTVDNGYNAVSETPLSFTCPEIGAVLCAGNSSIGSNKLSFQYRHRINTGEAAMRGPYRLNVSLPEDNKAWIKMVNMLPEGKSADDYIFVKSEMDYITSGGCKCKMDSRFDLAKGSGEIILMESVKEYLALEKEENDKVSYYTYSSDEIINACRIYMAFPKDTYVPMGAYTQRINVYTKASLLEDESRYKFAFSKEIPIDFSVLDYSFNGNLYSLTIRKDGNQSFGNMCKAYNKNKVAELKSLNTNVFAADTGTTRDIMVEYDHLYFVSNNSQFREAAESEILYRPLGKSDSLPAGCTGIDIYGKKAGGEYLLLGSIKKNMTSSARRNLQEALNQDFYSGIRYVFRDCNSELNYSGICPLAGLAYDKEQSEWEPTSVITAARMEVLENGKDKAAGFRKAITNIQGLADTVDECDMSLYGQLKLRAAASNTVSYRDSYLTCYMALNRGWSTSDGKTTTVMTDAGVLHDFEQGSELTSVVYKIILPKGVLVDGIHWSKGDSALSEYRFDDTDEKVSYGYIREHTRSYYESAEDGRDVFVAVTDFSDRSVDTCYESADNSPFYTYRMVIDDDYYQLLGMNGVSVRYRQEGQWNFKDGRIVKGGYNLNSRLPDVARSTYQGVELLVKTDGDYNRNDSIVQRGKEYKYRLKLDTGKSREKNVVFFCNLETAARGSDEIWQGDFVRLDLTAVRAAGALPSVYYSESETQDADLTSGGWTRSDRWQMDAGDIRSIAIDMGNFIFPPEFPIFADVVMTAPSDAEAGRTAFNSFCVSYDAYDGYVSDENAETAGAQESVRNLYSNITKVIMEKESEEADELTVRRKVKKEDYYGAHGNISAIYRIKDMEDDNKVWYEEISIGQDDFGEEPYAEKEFVITLPDGRYLVEEIDSSRFHYEKGELSGNTKWIESAAIVELNSNSRKTEEIVTFNAVRDRWNLYSHNDMRINLLD